MIRFKAKSEIGERGAGVRRVPAAIGDAEIIPIESEEKGGGRRESSFRETQGYCRSYSPLRTRLRTVKPAFLASVIESGLSSLGVLKPE